MEKFCRITPYEWDNPHPCVDDPDELETFFDMKNCLWFGMGSLMCQGSDILPRLDTKECPFTDYRVSIKIIDLTNLYLTKDVGTLHIMMTIINHLL